VCAVTANWHILQNCTRYFLRILLYRKPSAKLHSATFYTEVFLIYSKREECSLSARARGSWVFLVSGENCSESSEPEGLLFIRIQTLRWREHKASKRSHLPDKLSALSFLSIATHNHNMQHTACGINANSSCSWKSMRDEPEWFSPQRFMPRCLSTKHANFTGYKLRKHTRGLVKFSFITWIVII